MNIQVERRKKKFKKQEGNKPPNPNADSKGKRKVKYPYLICGGEHLTKEYPHKEEFNKFLKISPTPTVLKDPFPSQKQLIDHKSLNETSSSTNEVRMMSSEMLT